MNTRVVLTEDQTNAADGFLDFLMSDVSTYAVSGPAGTGKTFLMAHLANRVMQLYHNACKLIDEPPTYTSVSFTATTNKAAEVLEKALGTPVRTIHSYLGLKVQDNYRTGKTTITKTDNYRIRSNEILFIDECSMIDQELFKIILETMHDSKIVFIGDHCQMAPINETLSEVYRHLQNDNFSVLTQPVRNADSPPLMALCSQLRDTVETGIFKPILEIPGSIDFLDDVTMPQQLHPHFQDLDPSSRILLYTNQRVQAFNDFIRNDVRQLPAELQKGDVVVVASAFQKGKVNLSVERELTVHSVGPLLTDSTYTKVFNRPLEYRNVDFTTVPNIPVPDNKDFFNSLCKHFAKKKDWSNHFELKKGFADIRDKAACTVYKSQGSTYDSVFIDLGNIGTSYDAEQVARMLYVAVSRARYRVFFYGRLPSRYHNSLGAPLWLAPAM